MQQQLWAVSIQHLNTLYFNGFWTENALKARTTIKTAILFQVYEKLSPSGSTVVCVSNT